jgi:hypothetical protein
MRTTLNHIMKNRSSISILVILMLILTSCKFNSKMQNPGAEFIQGSWTAENVPNQDQLQRYELYDFQFNCDSVYVKIKTSSKTKMEVDSCYGNGEWAEYARGVYVVRGDSLIIEATYTHDDWRQKLTGCHHIGQYLPRFKITQQATDSLYLENRYSHIPIQLRKTATNTCVPKEVY